MNTVGGFVRLILYRAYTVVCKVINACQENVWALTNFVIRYRTFVSIIDLIGYFYVEIESLINITKISMSSSIIFLTYTEWYLHQKVFKKHINNESFVGGA